MFFYKTQNNETIRLGIQESVYEPQEDSMLLAKALEEKFRERKAKSVLDMGCGSGVLSIIAAKHGCKVLAADIDSAAVECARQNAEMNGTRLKLIQSDLFRNIEGKFDLIVFNPPYLPEEQDSGNRRWAGGRNLEIIERFIVQSKSHLQPKGEIIIVISSLSNPENVLKEFTNNNFDAKIEAEQKIPWEMLFVICAKHSY